MYNVEKSHTVEHGFDAYNFGMYIEQTFDGIKRFTIDLIRSITSYAILYHSVSKDMIVDFLYEMFNDSGLEWGEIAQFAKNDILTVSGIAQKQKWLEKHEKEFEEFYV